MISAGSLVQVQSGPPLKEGLLKNGFGFLLKKVLFSGRVKVCLGGGVFLRRERLFFEIHALIEREIASN